MFLASTYRFPGDLAMKIILYLILLLLMVWQSDSYIPAAQHALRIWSIDVVPSLFPYMVLCRLLASQLKNTRVPAAYIAVALGILGGSPSGASILSVYGHALPKQTILMLAALTGTISPMFLLNTVNQWIRDSSFTRALLICHLFGAAISCAFAHAYAHSKNSRDAKMPPPAEENRSQEDPFFQSTISILNIGGCIVMYSVVSVFVCSIPLFSRSPVASAAVHAVFETAGGIHALSSLPKSTLRAVLISAASGFSGLSILTQNFFFLRPVGIRMLHLLTFAFLRALATGGAMLVYQWLF